MKIFSKNRVIFHIQQCITWYFLESVRHHVDIWLFLVRCRKKAGLTSHRHRKKSIRHRTFPITMWIIDIVELHQVMPCTNSQKCCFYAWLYFSMKIFIHFNVVISRVDKHWHFFPLWNSNTLLIIISFSKIRFPSFFSLRWWKSKA